MRILSVRIGPFALSIGAVRMERRLLRPPLEVRVTSAKVAEAKP